MMVKPTLQQKIFLIQKIAQQERDKLLKKYGTLNGKCIEATDNLVYVLQCNGFNASAKQVWVLYEDFESCSAYCYEEHWLVKILIDKSNYYLDITLDQFQWAFTRQLPTIYFDRKKPNFYLDKEPGRVILSRCGWTSYYNTGNYINNFNYWD